MKMKPLDLARATPRSPREKLGGYVHLARMIDKARSKAAGTAGEYIYPCPLDQALLEFTNISPDDFYNEAQTRDDREFLVWFKENAKPKSSTEIESWNQTFLGRKPRNEASLQRFLETRNRLAPGRTDITTWPDLLDLEEGREVPVRDFSA